SIFIFIFIFFTSTNAATFNIRNNSPFTGADAVPGGGRPLDSGQTWDLTSPLAPQEDVYGLEPTATSTEQVEARAKQVTATGYSIAKTTPPNTLAEFGLNQFQNQDFFDISLVDGFNVVMEFIPTSNGCTSGPRP
ncbi:LOW QUALITY PROTEIN: hypothetical protein RJ639_010042, partial [Escallonia herrerae]